VNNNNLQYYGEVHIGDPPQRFLAIYDTGSEKLWVPGERCHGEACIHHHKFHPVKSQSFQQSIGGERRMTYGTGEVCR
ncbi:cathepsin e, putative, partial [Perkinsus marinus ATCC 50983]